MDGDFHKFRIEWKADYVKWYIDGKSGLEQLARPMEMLFLYLRVEFSLILWCVKGNTSGQWGGIFNYPGKKVTAYFRNVYYTDVKNNSINLDNDLNVKYITIF